MCPMFLCGKITFRTFRSSLMNLKVLRFCVPYEEYHFLVKFGFLGSTHKLK